MKKTATIFLALMTLCVGLASCGGGGADVKSEISTTTTGQQLIDLKKAYDMGAISQDEYNEQRKKILDND